MRRLRTRNEAAVTPVIALFLDYMSLAVLRHLGSLNHTRPRTKGFGDVAGRGSPPAFTQWPCAKAFLAEDLKACSHLGEYRLSEAIAAGKCW